MSWNHCQDSVLISSVCIKIRISELIPFYFPYRPYPRYFWASTSARNTDLKTNKSTYKWLIEHIMVSVRIEIDPSFSKNTKVGHLPQVGVGDGPRRPPESVTPELSQEKGRSLALLQPAFPLITSAFYFFVLMQGQHMPSGPLPVFL